VSAPAAVAGDAPSATASAKTIKVAGGEYFFRLSSKSAPKGRVTFRFTNKGSIKHDFKIAGKKSRLIEKGSYKYVCAVQGHAAAGMSASSACGEQREARVRPFVGCAVSL
jgi:hypothetical protein